MKGGFVAVSLTSLKETNSDVYESDHSLSVTSFADWCFSVNGPKNVYRSTWNRYPGSTFVPKLSAMADPM